MARRKAETLLQKYRAKRDFSKTREPDHRAARGRRGGTLSYVVQKHDATRLHYDFRLEWDGVLKSWAVTRGPSLDPSEKRLAVRTEDHPLSYGGFEGTIPEGQYGAGTVMLWDRGNWQPENDPEKGLKEGKLSFTLDGERLKGRWSLVRMSGEPGEKRENWLLIKSKDKEASQHGDVLRKHTKSVESGSTMHGIAAAASPAPKWREPQLATLVSEAPQGDDWLTEMKYDGYRTLIAIGTGTAHVYTRRGQDWTDRFAPIAKAAAALPTAGTLLDGEIVAFDAKGKTDFSALQKALSGGGAISCFVFDLLVEGEVDLTDRPLEERKRRLQKLLGPKSGPLIFSDHVRGHAAEVLRKLCGAGHEGVVAKRASSPYRSGRGTAWLKVKCTRRQEFVIVGYSPSDKPGRPFASLLLGAYEGERLAYRGRVGTGFDGETSAELARAFGSRRRKTPSLSGVPREIARTARWTRPDLVAEIEFTELTADGFLRHGVFKGLRRDKDPKHVVLEKPRNLRALS
ncbi:non-homologous end-joining DNA ligase [Nitratireductor sp. ZSWI3]|uniref:non-homologous end-joining DNA ligase n=1 Tax=Nitratireductor sp. ZSWI3 TaxID=2966359 RepID=UPI00214FFB45|nr:non-homologous end-joining DNA ligase [Nitratireductor sp. ZSWI3]MCR4264696.1 non-homologous end-joining DNA ligase [Nitratireductor sp. ZSWI3]